jgi:hypothetical protein
MTYNLYIGSNNTSHKVELLKIKNVLNDNFDGYTISAINTGVWQGVEEESVTVTIICEEVQMYAVVRKLNTILDQDAIAFQKVAELNFEEGRQ